MSAVLLQSHELLRAEGLVVGLRCGLDEILEVRSKKEVAQVDELAVVLVLNIDHSPAVLTAANLLAVDNDVLLGSHNGKWNKALSIKSVPEQPSDLVTFP